MALKLCKYWSSKKKLKTIITHFGLKCTAKKLLYSPAPNIPTENRISTLTVYVLRGLNRFLIIHNYYQTKRS